MSAGYLQPLILPAMSSAIDNDLSPLSQLEVNCTQCHNVLNFMPGMRYKF